MVAGVVGPDMELVFNCNCINAELLVLGEQVEGQFLGQFDVVFLVPVLVGNVRQGAVEVYHWGLDADLIIDPSGDSIRPAGDDADDVALLGGCS